MRAALTIGSLITLVLVLGVAITPAQQPATVEMRDFSFSPRDMVVTTGSAVRWVNLDEAPHQIAMAGGRPGSSGLIDPGKEYEFTFREAGQFTYRCAVHPTMLGVIVVQGP